MTKVHRFFKLPPEERRTVFKAWWMLSGFWIAIRTMPFRKVTKLAKLDLPTHHKLEPETGALATLQTTAWCVRAAAGTHLMPMKCLERSLTLQRILRRRGIAADFRIGVEKQGESIGAHAWLEVAGKPIAEPQEVSERFLPILSH